jgi:hypothetical protein
VNSLRQLLKSPGFIAVAVGLLTFAPLRVGACTIFVLTDGTRALFFNNEDWFNRTTRLWFVPAGTNHLGCAYLGFDNGWAQGGLNTAGLAFDWVSGFDEEYKPDPELEPARGNPSERMLETCTTVEEAVAFYRRFLEPDFKRSRVLIADRTGASVVIGAREGRLHISRFRRSRGFGWGRTTLERELAKTPEPTIANGAAILRACLQPGDGGTKYSNVFDLETRDIVLFPFPGREEQVTLNLEAELAKGGHYYDIAKCREQLTTRPQPLLANMKRFYLDEVAPIADLEPAVTARIRSLIRDAAVGTMQETHYTIAFWGDIRGSQQEIQADVKRLGDFVSLTLVERHSGPEGRSYRYLVEFRQARVLGRYVLDEHDKVALIQSEAIELKPASTKSN